MRRALFASALLCATLPAAAQTGPRNPFWPRGYEGTRHPITLEPRFAPKAAPEPAPEELPSEEEPVGLGAQLVNLHEGRLWAAARKRLTFGSTISCEENDERRAAIMLNGKLYSAGDLVSLNHDGHRFTWKIESLTEDGKLRLKCIKLKNIKDNEQ